MSKEKDIMKGGGTIKTSDGVEGISGGGGGGIDGGGGFKLRSLPRAGAGGQVQPAIRVS